MINFDKKLLDLCWKESNPNDKELLRKLAEDLDQDTLEALGRGIINTAYGNYKFGMLKGIALGTISAVSGMITYQVITNTDVVWEVKHKIKSVKNIINKHKK